MARNLFVAILILLLPATAFADDLQVVGERPRSETTPFRLHGELGAIRHTQGQGILTQLIARYRFTRYFFVDAAGRAAGLGNEPDDLFYFSMSIGPGVTTGEDFSRFEYRLALRANHVHVTEVQSWKDNTLHNLMGDSEGTVEHRSGLEVSAGVTFPTFLQVGKYKLITNLDLLGTWLPSSDELYTGLGAVLGVSVYGW